MIPIGSNGVLLLATRLALLAFESFEHLLDAAFGGQQGVLAQPTVVDLLVRRKFQGEVVAAGSYEFDEGLKARGDCALFPSGDDRSVPPRPFG
jgi:hypothetical protein